ncbi:hypothetical protein ACTWPT_57235 [Nonomuraea sp. 3N208]|uniref:hypothetical protein n=1 Tax=Nonomuraea sp. 3N208 TaxID=3457421 RepID=UPI003FD1295A
MGYEPPRDLGKLGQTLARSQETAVTSVASFLVLGVVAAALLGISWLALLGGVMLAVFGLAIPPLLVFLPWRVSSDLARPAVAGPATTILNLTAGGLIELARLGVVTFLDAQPRDAVWLGLGVHVLNVVLALVLFGVAVLLAPSPSGQEHAMPGRSYSSSYWRGFFGFGRNIVVDVGLSLLLVWSPWLALLTIPVGAVWGALVSSDRPRVPGR